MVNGTSANVTEEWQNLIKMAYSEVSYSTQVIYSIALFIVFIASCVGNILTCVVIYYDKTMHTATNCYLFNLAVSDLLATFPILIIIYQLLTHDTDLVQFKQGIWSCNFIICIHFFVITILLNNGILVMTALSIERYIAICYPMILKDTPVWQRVGKILAIIWTIAIIEAVPDFFMVDIVGTGKSSVCLTLPSKFFRIASGVLAVVTFIIPLGIMTYVYTKIAFRVNDSNKRYNLKDSVLNNKLRRKKVKKLIALTVSFVVCWFPFFVIRAVIFAIDLEHIADLHRWWVPAHKVAMFNSSFSTVVNPLVFSIMSTKFRKSLKKLWTGKLRKRKPHTLDVESQHHIIKNKHLPNLEL